MIVVVNCRPFFGGGWGEALRQQCFARLLFFAESFNEPLGEGTRDEARRIASNTARTTARIRAPG